MLRRRLRMFDIGEHAAMTVQTQLHGPGRLIRGLPGSENWRRNVGKLTGAPHMVPYLGGQTGVTSGASWGQTPCRHTRAQQARICMCRHPHLGIFRTRCVLGLAHAGAALAGGQHRNAARSVTSWPFSGSRHGNLRPVALIDVTSPLHSQFAECNRLISTTTRV
jgi:hypothetical protein